MLNFKELAENILMDLMNNGSISDILLKTKIFASKKGDKELLDWVSHELEGYEEKTPKYRILNSGLRVEVHVPYQGIVRLDFPVDIIENDDARNRLSNIPFFSPIGEIEDLCNNTEGDDRISMKVPVFAYRYMSGFINGNIQDAYQYTTKAAVGQIVTAVKNVLIDFLLKVGEEENINFNNYIKTIPQMITINNSGIMNTGSGDVNAEGVTIVNGDKNVICAENKEELFKILEKIDEIAAAALPNSDYEEVVKDIKAELQKDIPQKNMLRRFFSAIPTFLSGVGASIVANQLNPLITSALALL